MTRDQWINAYALRVIAKADWRADEAMAAAQAAADWYESLERAAHNKLVWENPEAEADEEMSNWTDDEGTP